jgi:GTPase SAR1 family protein
MSSINEDKYRKLIDFLHDSNVDNFIDLPQIVVMGDTSSGKSSLLSLLSGIDFPASKSITTLCPARLHLEKCDKYQASITIKWDINTSTPATFEPLIYEGKESFAKIPKGIAEAQKIILEAVSRGVAFDIIEISVKSPQCVDLTLVDLPGYVRSTGN